MQSNLSEMTKDEILHSHPIVSNNNGSDLYVTMEAARLSMDKYAVQWKDKYDELKIRFDKLEAEATERINQIAQLQIEKMELLLKIS